MSAIEAAAVRCQTMAGQVFGLLVVLARSDRRATDGRRPYVWCTCNCGTTKEVRLAGLRSGSVKSCGCQQLAGMQVARLKSGARRSTEPELRKFYAAWCGMKARCRNPNHKDYKYYGGRGLDVCERWESFDNFKADMWPRPDGKTIDRVDVNKGYSPDNCRWASSVEQRRNQRRVTK